METNTDLNTPSGVATGFVGAKPVNVDWEREEAEQINIDYTAPENVVTCVDLRDHPEVHHIARKLWFVNKHYVSHKGFSKVGLVFKNCIIADISKAFTFQFATRNTLSEEEILTLNTMRHTHYMVLPTKYLLRKASSRTKAPNNAEFFGINLRPFYGNILTGMMSMGQLEIIGVLQNGRMYKGDGEPLIWGRNRVSPSRRSDEGDIEYVDIESDLYAKLGALLDLV